MSATGHKRLSSQALPIVWSTPRADAAPISRDGSCGLIADIGRGITTTTTRHLRAGGGTVHSIISGHWFALPITDTQTDRGRYGPKVVTCALFPVVVMISVVLN
jgi:hypothetical protein